MSHIIGMILERYVCLIPDIVKNTILVHSASGYEVKYEWITLLKAGRYEDDYSFYNNTPGMFQLFGNEALFSMLKCKAFYSYVLN